MLATGHDGRTAIRIAPTPIRVVCQNTLNLAIRMHQDALCIPHTPKLKENLDAAAALAAITHRYRQAEAAFRAMARVKLDKNMLNVYLAGVFPLPRGRSEGDESAYVAEGLGGSSGISSPIFGGARP